MTSTENLTIFIDFYSNISLLNTSYWLGLVKRCHLNGIEKVYLLDCGKRKNIPDDFDLGKFFSHINPYLMSKIEMEKVSGNVALIYDLNEFELYFDAFLSNFIDKKTTFGVSLHYLTSISSEKESYIIDLESKVQKNNQYRDEGMAISGMILGSISEIINIWPLEKKDPNLTERISRLAPYGFALPRYSNEIILSTFKKNNNEKPLLNKALFLDRDGILNKDTGYTHKASDFQFIPGMISFLKDMQDRGFKLIIITNQAGIAKGKFKEKDFFEFQTFLIKKYRDEEIKITDTFYCPYHKEGIDLAFKKDSLLRKPEPGMVLKAAEKHHIDLTKSCMIGDRDTDRIKLPYLKSYILKGSYKLDPNSKNYSDISEIFNAILLDSSK